MGILNIAQRPDTATCQVKCGASHRFLVESLICIIRMNNVILCKNKQLLYTQCQETKFSLVVEYIINSTLSKV